LANAKELDTCGLGYRLPYVLGAAKDVASGLLDLKELYSYDDEELFNELKKVKGVGDKVANCICLFAYHRIARAPKDVWINRVIEEEYSGIDPFPKYDKYAGIMQQYMFYAAKNSSA
jgi:N-glycosylase/DNA lyase